MAEIFVCKPGSISCEDRDALSRAGIVVVQMDDPTAFRLVRSDCEITGGAMLRAALKGLSSSSDNKYSNADTNRTAFVDELAAHEAKQGDES